MSVVALPHSEQPSHEIDLDVQRLVLDVANRKVRGLDTRIDAAIIDGELERTIEGASTLTLTLHDPRRALLRSGMFAHAIDVRLDRLTFRLAKVAKSDDDLTLTFEDREVAYLRQHAKPRKAARSKMTRAEFALALVREVKAGGGIKFVCPELHAKQPIEKQSQRRTPRERSENREPGLTGEGLTVKDRKADKGQLRLMERVLDVADSVGAGERPTLALVEACIVESTFHNYAGGDLDSRGILQVRDSTARGLKINNRDVEACVRVFLGTGFAGRGGAMKLARLNPKWTGGQIAQGVQGSAFPLRYDQYELEAKRIIAAYGGLPEESSFDMREVTRNQPYHFRRGGQSGERENSWTCLQRLAEEVRWRCFMSAGSLYFIAEDTLMKAKPRLVLSEESPGVKGIDFDLDSGKKAQTATIYARASRWLAAPGAVVQLSECGPANGRWLVASIRRGLFDADAEVNLKRPVKPLPEPAAETTTTTVETLRRDSAAARAYRAAQQIHQHRYPYVWGGGHLRAGTPSGGMSSPSGGPASGIGYDCSGSTVAVLAAGGMGFKPGGRTDVSSGLMNWGEAGEGEFLTVYANPTHVFIVFHKGVGKPHDEHFGTGDWGKGWRGAGFNPQMHPIAGFTARHWEGT